MRTAAARPSTQHNGKARSKHDGGSAEAGTIRQGKRRLLDDDDDDSADDDEHSEDSGDSDEDESEDEEEEEEEDGDEEELANGPDAYGLAILNQLGIDPSSLPSASASAGPSKPRTASPSGKAATSSKANAAAATAIKKPTIGTVGKAPKAGATGSSAAASARHMPGTIVFDGSGTLGSSSSREVENTYVDSKAARKAFMSSRIQRIGGEDSSSTGKGKGLLRSADDDEEEAQEKEHKANDRLLSHLLSTTLFAPGADASSSPALKRNGKPSLDPSKGTLASILELSTTTEQRKGAVLGRGWGDAQARLRELGKMPGRLQQGLRRAAKERVETEKERARELGLVHRSLHTAKGKKKGKSGLAGTGAVSAVDMALSGVGSSKKPRDRVRGLGMGVGRFGAGKLTLSARDVEKINGPSSSSRRGGGKHGGGGGRGGGPPKKKQRRR